MDLGLFPFYGQRKLSLQEAKQPARSPSEDSRLSPSSSPGDLLCLAHTLSCYPCWPRALGGSGLPWWIGACCFRPTSGQLPAVPPPPQEGRALPPQEPEPEPGLCNLLCQPALPAANGKSEKVVCFSGRCQPQPAGDSATQQGKTCCRVWHRGRCWVGNTFWWN